MQILTQTLETLKIGPARSFGGLTLWPLLDGDGKRPERFYRTLDEALADRSAYVTEIGEAGSVPELRFVNDGDRPVLLLDGEELTGAKQNRVLNLTILVPAGKAVVIPVSCVEAGRWADETERFSAAQHVMYSAGRSAKVAQVSRSLKSAGRRTSNQRAVWDGIAKLQRRYGVSSKTSKLHDVFASRGRQIDEYVRELGAVDGQVGAAFALGSRLRGVEVFDHPHTLRELLPKLVRSWALDATAIAARGHEVPPAEAVRDFLAEIGSAEATSHAGVGLGDDVRLGGRRLAGGALVHDGQVVHLCAFRIDEEGSEQSGKGSGMVAASRRWLRRRS
jgi:hypothetical protein